MDRRIPYVLSLPERALRAAAAGLGGVLFQVAVVLVPDAIRRSRLYQAIVARLLRIVVELVGGVQGVFPLDDVDLKELAVRKTAGNVIELASFMAVGWSPLWLLAAAADLTGGTRLYLRTLVSELQRDGLLPAEADIGSVEDLLQVLEGTSGLMAETVDVPPVNVRDMRRSWQALQQNVSALPEPKRLLSIYTQLQQVAAQEGRSLLAVSSLVALGALRAGGHLSQVYLFDFYQATLHNILQEGLAAYVWRVSRPYLRTARAHFAPATGTYTERLLGHFFDRGISSQAEPPTT